MKKKADLSQAQRLSSRYRSLNTQYLRAYRKKIESDKSAEDIIQTAKFNLKLENAKLPRGESRRQLSLIDLINATDIQS